MKVPYTLKFDGSLQMLNTAIHTISRLLDFSMGLDYLDTWNFICSHSMVNVGHMPNFGPLGPPVRPGPAQKGRKRPVLMNFSKFIITSLFLGVLTWDRHHLKGIFQSYKKWPIKIILWRHQGDQNWGQRSPKSRNSDFTENGSQIPQNHQKLK